MKTTLPGTSTTPNAQWWINHAHTRGHRYSLPIKAWQRETWTKQ